MCRSPRLSPSTTTHYPGGLEGESKQEGVDVMEVGGLLKRRKLDEKCSKIHLLEFVIFVF